MFPRGQCLLRQVHKSNRRKKHTGILIELETTSPRSDALHGSQVHSKSLSIGSASDRELFLSSQESDTLLGVLSLERSRPHFRGRNANMRRRELITNHATPVML